MLTSLLRNTLFVTHVVHVDRGVALKFPQAVNGAEIESFRMIIMAGSGISNADFHFANWIDRHGRDLPLNGFRKCEEGLLEKIQQLAISKGVF
jgi:hypothetical protein